MLSLAKLGRGSEGYYLDAVAKGAEDYYVGRGEAPGYWACEHAGHPPHQKVHTGDLWIAATAVRRGLTLVSDDTVFDDCPELQLIRESS